MKRINKIKFPPSAWIVKKDIYHTSSSAYSKLFDLLVKLNRNFMSISWHWQKMLGPNSHQANPKHLIAREIRAKLNS